MILSPLVVFILTCVAVELTPGPNMAWLALLAAQRGRAAGLMAAVGVAVGLTLMGVIAGVGLGTLLSGQPALYQAVRWAGVGFLVYLAWDAWREANSPLSANADGAGALTLFWRGVVTNLLNPKAALFFIAVVPNYTVSEPASVAELALLSGIYVAIATLVHVLIVLGASLLQPMVSQAGNRRHLGLVFALLLLLVAAWLAWSTRLA